MNSADSYIDAQEKLMTLNLLQIAFKKFETYDSMRLALERNGVEVSIANLSRYIYGKAIPKSKLKDEILKALTQDKEFGLSFKKLIGNHVKTSKDISGNVRLSTALLLTESRIMKAIAFLTIYKRIVPDKITKIIALEGDSAYFAMTLAHILNIDCVFVQRSKPLGINDFITTDVQNITFGRIESIGVSEQAFSPQEKALIVGDVIRSGNTLTALIDLVRRCNAEPVTSIILTGVGSKWKNQKEWNEVELRILNIYE